MTLDEARAVLIENAVGDNEYDNITTWQELSEAAEREIMSAEDRISQLSDVASEANDQLGESL
jgi:hypothetical protein